VGRRAKKREKTNSQRPIRKSLLGTCRMGQGRKSKMSKYAGWGVATKQALFENWRNFPLGLKKGYPGVPRDKRKRRDERRGGGVTLGSSRDRSIF